VYAIDSSFAPKWFSVTTSNFPQTEYLGLESLSDESSILVHLAHEENDYIGKLSSL